MSYGCFPGEVVDVRVLRCEQSSCGIRLPKIEVITCVTTRRYLCMDILEATGLSDGPHRIV